MQTNSYNIERTDNCMAKKEKKNYDYNKGIENRNISEACTEYMKLFGANNNLMRHLPSVYDGLIK